MGGCPRSMMIVRNASELLHIGDSSRSPATRVRTSTSRSAAETSSRMSIGLRTDLNRLVIPACRAAPSQNARLNFKHTQVVQYGRIHHLASLAPTSTVPNQSQGSRIVLTNLPCTHRKLVV